MKKQMLHCVSAALLGLALAALLFWLGTTTPARADPNIHCVNESGSGCGGDCGGCYSFVQAAVDAASAGNEIRIAGGAYNPGGTVAVITKELRIIGAFDPATFDGPDPDMYQTVLDAGWGGSVISITNAGDVLLQHLMLTHGDGSGNCGSNGCGGGIYAMGTNLHAGHCVITNNVGSRSGGAMGGGIYVYNNHVDLWGSRIVSNTAAYSSSTSFQYGHGGGVFVQMGTASLWENEVLDNVGSVLHGGSGGIHLSNVAQASVLTNTIRGNSANVSNYWSSGGGLYIVGSSAVYISGNRIEDNWAALLAGYGGGAYVYNSDAHLARNIIISNTTGTLHGYGGGVCVLGTTPVTLSNNLIARNHASTYGGGVCAGRSVPPASQAILVNNTIVDNGDTGVMAEAYAILTITNNIVADHAVGITVTVPASATVTADHNLFWNTADPIVGTNAVLADPSLWPSYRLRDGSPALNAGLAIPWLRVDLEGNPRPQDGAWDIGAFEGARWEVYLPLVLR